jgi:Holliday junction resolvasome RuvABC endonuclease subunit
MIIGFDISTKYVGIAITDNDGQRIRSEEIKLIGETFEDRMEHANRVIYDLALDYCWRTGARFAVESPFVGPSGRTSMQLAKMCGAVHGIIYTVMSVRVIEVTPAEAKAAMTGKGNATKQAMMQMARARYALETVGEHEADALAVCLAAAIKLERERLEALG